jgi:hypothetical protein
MAFDEQLADRIRKRLGKRAGIKEKQMFGGIAFLLKGNICCAVRRDEMLVRVDPATTDKALAQPHTRPFDLMRGPMKGWILVGPKALATSAGLGKWIGVATKYAGSLPAKR